MVRLSDFDYHLPEELIAQTPLSDRAASRLLHLDKASGDVAHLQFRNCPGLLNEGDVLVLNNTRVNAWRFIGEKSTGAKIEILALKELEQGVFECLVKPAKRLKLGDPISISPRLVAELVGQTDETTRLIRFSSAENIYLAMDEAGTVPLPPYITESLDDKERYQTVIAQHPGSAAAPTAGLHFTPEILDQIKAKGVDIVEVTLHVGIDTFRPIQTDDVTNHQMHGEICEVSPQAAQRINERKGRLIAVGTTSVRTLESFATHAGEIEPGRQESRIFITPGYKFRAIDGMFTNFHLPKTTMLLMISALAGRENILIAYDEAVRNRYRFLSFGDSMLII
ncbi:MAG: tRNA preQ1(34) S-adenosylmethionine ribosyltransferase-isomerase QueA [Armatimonadota bacterium]